MLKGEASNAKPDKVLLDRFAVKFDVWNEMVTNKRRGNLESVGDQEDVETLL